MKKISEIISKELFLNAFEICQEYCKSEEFILDVNFRLLKNTFLMLSPKIVSNYYDEMIKNDFVYSLPELFSSDIVLIPKKLTSVREYRFFSVYSMILYNAVGLLFVDSCSEMLNNVNFNRNKINAFYPTKFKRKDNKWIVSNDYKTEYKKFTESLKKSILPNDIILQIDISNYFENISHNILISLLTDFAPESLLNKHNYNVDSDSILEFYFNSLMQRSYSIPQGRKNFVSDYFGYFYLIPFEMEIHNITKHDSLKFKKIIRYVDYIYIIFNTDIVDSSIIFKELLKIEHCISE